MREAWLPAVGLARLTLDHVRRGLREIMALTGTVQASTLGYYLLAIGTTLGRVMRSASLAPADSCMLGRTIWLDFGGQRYDLTGVPFSLIREIYCKHVYFPDPTWYPKADDLVLDLGANLGAFSLLCAKRRSRVIAIEMSRTAAVQMRDLLHRNDCEDMVSYVHGLVAPLPPLRQSGIDPRAGEPAALFGADLDALADGRTIALAKVDIEGSEFGLFLGDAGWLANVRRLTMEVHPDFGDPAALRDRLRSLGFRAWLTDKLGAEVDRIVEPVGFCYALR